ncbi:N-acetyllactosaminide beta-1,3-N-acetylglucosaminyltransferase 3-like [Hyla sarda]|uniref:N-acetyllactosaminide beta-1,3-N-acetylglucosaminyltransferase 3-like n=1 Tax=Hyla sarda TaxID=327740 RepID=UPI0024C38820|nr:N-acetyllactosaminide beta-1,3-N-acetylglucosaminyltransferase 3-like [Hyla sarda]
MDLRNLSECTVPILLWGGRWCVHCIIRRRRPLIAALSLALSCTLSLLAWLIVEGEPIWELPDLQDPFPANLSAPPSLRRSVTLYDTNFSFFLDLPEYNKHYPALQNYRCRAIIGLLGYCRVPGPLILMAIKSHASAKKRRDALRNTWAKERRINGFTFKPVFLMANSRKKKEMIRLIKEASVFGDILLWDFFESHHNLSLKERCFLEWLYYRCQEANYIFKGDDDEFVNPQALAEYISTSDSANRLKIHGQLQVHPPPDRWGKYAVPLSVYPHMYYPPFVSGGGFLVPGELVPSLHWAATTIPVFPLDDVFIGFLALATKVQFHHDSRFFSFGLKNDDDCHYRDVLVVHGLTPQRMLEVWEALPYVKSCPPEKD